MALDRQAARQAILKTVREMAKEFPKSEYCEARETFGLLGIIRRICNNCWPTAKQCWEGVGLSRSHLVDEFEFAQTDLKSKTT